jgi:putative DNA primase/helicase
MIDFNQTIGGFPHVSERNIPKATIANLKHVFNEYGIICEYDEVLKKQTIKVTTEANNDLSESSNYSKIRSLLALNDVPLSCADLIPALLEQNRVNPVLDWIKSKKYDKKRDYIGDLMNSITTDDGDIVYKEMVMQTWLIQCVAALDCGQSTPNDDALPKYELVLVLQGGQGVKKTSWIQRLLPRDLTDYIILGAHLDPSDKDSVKRCISGWICELGELDATFRKADIARLKAFLSNETDSIRLPYDRVTSTFKRRTSFCASVNPKEFLTDSTGARRFLPLAVTACDHKHIINMQQVWAQVFDLYTKGEQWWCTNELDLMLASRHATHSETNSIAELISEKFDLKNNERTGTSFALSITRLLSDCGVNLPTPSQLRQAKDVLDKNGFKAVYVKGVKSYWLNNLNDD